MTICALGLATDVQAANRPSEERDGATLRFREATGLLGEAVILLAEQALLQRHLGRMRLLALRHLCHLDGDF